MCYEKHIEPKNLRKYKYPSFWRKATNYNSYDLLNPRRYNYKLKLDRIGRIQVLSTRTMCKLCMSREHWMVFRGPSFLAVVWFCSSPKVSYKLWLKFSLIFFSVEFFLLFFILGDMKICMMWRKVLIIRYKLRDSKC